MAQYHTNNINMYLKIFLKKIIKIIKLSSWVCQREVFLYIFFLLFCNAVLRTDPPLTQKTLSFTLSVKPSQTHRLSYRLSGIKWTGLSWAHPSADLKGVPCRRDEWTYCFYSPSLSDSSFVRCLACVNEMRCMHSGVFLVKYRLLSVRLGAGFVILHNTVFTTNTMTHKQMKRWVTTVLCTASSLSVLAASHRQCF